MNYVHHEGHGFHLSVSRDGVVSLWDTKEAAQTAHKEDAYLWLDLTEAQYRQVFRAQQAADEAATAKE